MAHQHRPSSAGRLRRLAEELEEAGFSSTATSRSTTLVLEEVDHALRPPVYERRVPSMRGDPRTRRRPGTWEAGTELADLLGPIGEQPLPDARRFADGLSSWVDPPRRRRRRVVRVRSPGRLGARPRGAERRRSAPPRAAPPHRRRAHRRCRSACCAGTASPGDSSRRCRRGSSNVTRRGRARGPGGARRACSSSPCTTSAPAGSAPSSCYRPDDAGPPSIEERLAPPPPLQIRRPPASPRCATRSTRSTAPPSSTPRRAHASSAPGWCRAPRPADQVDGYRGMRHTSGRRYSFDDPAGHGDRRQRGRPGHRAAQRRAPRHVTGQRGGLADRSGRCAAPGLGGRRRVLRLPVGVGRRAVAAGLLGGVSGASRGSGWPVLVIEAPLFRPTTGGQLVSLSPPSSDCSSEPNRPIARSLGRSFATSCRCSSLARLLGRVVIGRRHAHALPGTAGSCPEPWPAQTGCPHSPWRGRPWPRQSNPPGRAARRGTRDIDVPVARPRSTAPSRGTTGSRRHRPR